MTDKSRQIIQLILTTVTLLSTATLYAMGACPEACNNQVTKEDCNGYQCYQDDNQSVPCKWHQHAVDKKRHCRPQKAPTQ